MNPEIRTKFGWRPLRNDGSPHEVAEVDTLHLRGLPPDSRVRIGVRDLDCPTEGEISIRLPDDQLLAGHVGLVELRVDGRRIGEISVVPTKMSKSSFELLRTDLHRVWTDLALDPGGTARVNATIPGAAELWRRIEGPVHEILDHPAETLEIGTAVRRIEQVRHRRELRPAVVKAGRRNHPALVHTTRRSTSTPENRMVHETLILLRRHAGRDPEGANIARRLDGLIRKNPHPATRPTRLRPTWGMRADARYRRVLAVRQILDRPELAATEGPGELRLGIRALPRLYEYWVFLQVLVECAARYGAPAEPGFNALAIRQSGSRARLEIPAGTTIEFPGPVYVAFEPRITTRSDGWMGIEYVPHPDRDRQQLTAQPDVVVFRPATPSWITVFDAKYVGRHWVHQEASTIHEKYSRMRWNGSPVVRNVVAIHPHRGLDAQWAGYGYLGLWPGGAATPLPIPRPATAAIAEVRSADPEPTVEGTDTAADSWLDPQPVSVVADQYWMHRHLGDRRIDLTALVRAAAGGSEVRSCDILVPEIEKLDGFAVAAAARGFDVRRDIHEDRQSQIASLIDLIRQRRADGEVVVVSGDPELLSRLPTDVRRFSDIESLPAPG